MYPGTYQPLQATSLLLADLLQYPYSDEASSSRGLVDAIFSLYEVDEGIVSQNDPPRRRLSPSGREAWSMLVQTRNKALEQMGEDHHVLLPSHLAYSEFCVCGEKFARNPPGMRPRSEDRESSTSLRNCFETTEQGFTPAPTLTGNIDFDWQEWDSCVGMSTGLMS